MAEKSGMERWREEAANDYAPGRLEVERQILREMTIEQVFAYEMGKWRAPSEYMLALERYGPVGQRRLFQRVLRDY